MNIRVEEFDVIKKKLNQNNKQIIVFGAGMIGTVTILEMLMQWGIDDKIAFYVDNDKSKWNTKIKKNKREYKIYPVEKLKEINPQEHIILLSTSRFSDTLNQLNEMDNLKNIDCYIMPMLCIENFQSHKENIVSKTNKEPVIPKRINYMWLGGKNLPTTLQRCVDSWKRFCPDYEIVRYDENNYNVDQIPYMKDAYQRKAYGFVPDYARIDILFHHGGIYLDTDVELVKPLDDMLFQDGFCCVEKWQTVNFGGGSGAKPGLEILGELLEYRRCIPFILENGNENRNTCGFYDTVFFIDKGYQLNGQVQNIQGMNIYPSEVFHPYDYMSGRIERTNNTFGIHHFNGGWLDKRQENANILTKKMYDDILRKAKRNERMI